MNILDQFKIDGKVAVVTGASSGIGKRVALGYAQAGAKVALVARGEEMLSTTLAELQEATGAELMAITCDVTGEESVAAMVEAVCAKWGRVDVAVCNAGIVTLNGLEEMPLEEFESIQKTNVNGVFLTAQTCAKAMIAQGDGGSIIVTASMSGHVINTPQQIGHYCTSKAAAIQLAKAMAVEFAPHEFVSTASAPDTL